MEHVVKVSNSKLVRNVDGLLSRREVDVSVNWIGNNKIRDPPQKLSCLINFLLDETN